MHGFFMHVRLYKKAKSAQNPITYNEYKKKTFKQKIIEQRMDRLKLIKLPSVNKQLAEHLLQSKSSITDADIINPTGDNRFKQLFHDSNFQIDTNNDHYKLLENIGALKKTKLESNKKIEEIVIDEQEEDPTEEVELEDINTDEEEQKSINYQEYELTSVSNNYDIFSTSNTDKILTLEEKLKKSKYFKFSNQHSDEYGDKEIQYVPENNKKKKERYNFEKLQHHIEDKKQFGRNTSKSLPIQAKKLLRRGFKRLKLKKNNENL
ncbi:hypothetical protein HZS_2424 [Henneguya salminicola]|nr:hypothetical protein HZS_2424 [Henneguya salminicola]